MICHVSFIKLKTRNIKNKLEIKGIWKILLIKGTISVILSDSQGKYDNGTLNSFAWLSNTYISMFITLKTDDFQ